MKKIFLIAAIAVAGVAAWAASNTNSLKADDADAAIYEIMAYGTYLGACEDGDGICMVCSCGGICYTFPGRINYFGSF